MDRADGALEILDRPVALADRVASLADIDRLNAWFGGYALTLREIRRVVAAVPGGDALVAVDVGGGHAAFGVRLVDWARGARRAIRVVVVDRMWRPWRWRAARAPPIRRSRSSSPTRRRCPSERAPRTS